MEFRWHCDFFIQQDDFEETYQLWYSFELEEHWDIIKGVLFDWMIYTLHVKVLICARKIIGQTSPGIKCSTDSDIHPSKGPQYFSTVDIFFSHMPFQSSPTCLLCGRDH
jgi:hypothetical protein